MNNMLRAFFTAIALWAGAAFAQSPPSPAMYYGFVPTPAQFNNYFVQKQDYLGYVPLNAAGGVLSGRLVTAAPSATRAGFNLTPGTSPGSPLEGDMWATATTVFVRINGSTVALGGAPNVAAASFFGNVLGTTAPNTNFTVSGLVARGVPDPNNDLLVILDATSGTLKKVTSAQIASAGVAGVSSIAGNTGAFTLGNGLTNTVNQIRFANVNADSFWMNRTGSAAAPSQVAFPSCSGAASVLQYNIATHVLGCATVGLGSVTSVAAGTGLTGGTITTSGTISLSVPVLASMGGTGVVSPAANTVPVNQGASAQTNTGVGQGGQCLAGTGGAPTFINGCRVLIATYTASNSATIQDTSILSAGYNEYEFVMESLTPQNNGVGLQFQVYSGGFQAANYSTYGIGTGGAGYVPTTFVPITRQIIANLGSGGQGVSGTFRHYPPGPGGVTNVIGQSGSITNATNYDVFQFGGAWYNGSAVTGFRMSFTTGNIVSGVLKIYGLK